MPPQNPQHEPITDPRFIYAEDSNVIAYRLGLVESNISSMDVKLDKIINEYPTVTMLDLILNPLRDKVEKLETSLHEEQKDKVKDKQQMKYLAIAAIIGPLGTFIITIIMGRLIGGTI